MVGECFNRRLREVGGGAWMLHVRGIEPGITELAMVAAAPDLAVLGEEDGRRGSGGRNSN